MIAGVMAGHTLVLSGDERHGAVSARSSPQARSPTSGWNRPCWPRSTGVRGCGPQHRRPGGRCGDDIVTDWWHVAAVSSPPTPPGRGWATRAGIARSAYRGQGDRRCRGEGADERLAEAAAGEIGDVYVSGEAVARGLFIRMGTPQQAFRRRSGR